ncbi:hypothetical Protein psc1_03530 [Candidatus Phytoplasma solani]
MRSFFIFSTPCENKKTKKDDKWTNNKKLIIIKKIPLKE